MGRIYTSSINGKPLNISSAQPLDVRCVVQSAEDLVVRTILQTSYVGMVVYVVDDESLYVCYYKPTRITNTIKVNECWRKLDYSTRIVENIESLTDGTTIMFPYQGMMAYVTSESTLYVLTTKGVENAKDINNWRKISVGTSSIDKVGINKAPEGGSGFKITENKDVDIEDYVNVENHIKANGFYTSKGINSFEPNSNFTHDSVKLSKGGESYIELFANGDNWIAINDPDNSLGLLDLSGKTIEKETSLCFGIDIKFTDGWTISYGEESRAFVDGDYELIDIYRNVYSPEVYAYLNDIDVKVLTEDDLIMIEDKINNLAHSIMIDLGEDDGDSDGSDSGEESVPLQQVIVNMNNSITKLEQSTVEPETIDHSEIDNLFS